MTVGVSAHDWKGWRKSPSDYGVIHMDVVSVTGVQRSATPTVSVTRRWHQFRSAFRPSGSATRDESGYDLRIEPYFIMRCDGPSWSRQERRKNCGFSAQQDSPAPHGHATLVAAPSRVVLVPRAVVE